MLAPAGGIRHRAAGSWKLLERVIGRSPPTVGWRPRKDCCATAGRKSEGGHESDREQRRTIAAAYLGWTLDAFHFFLLTFVLKDIAKEFGVEISPGGAGDTLSPGRRIATLQSCR